MPFSIPSRSPGQARRALGACLATAMLATPGCQDQLASRFSLGEGPAAAPADDRSHRLVVLLVIDQFPQWAFAAKRPALRGGGFDRLLTEGKWRLGRYPSAVTLTAPGHATLGTGVTADAHGIIANEWWRRDLGRSLASVRDGSGVASASALTAPALGDAVAAAGRGGKVFSVSLKDRAALLPVGPRGTAIWYEPRTVDWTSNAALPWLDRWNQTSPIAQHLHHVWTPLSPARLGALSGRRDYQVGEAGDKGFDATFPHEVDRTRVPAEALLATPLGNQLVLDTALAAIAGAALGADRVPDLLVVSLSAHDYITHAWGHESWEAWDTALRLDRQLGEFLAGLDRAVGASGWSLLLTSDHGASPLPELSGSGRTRFGQILATANAAASRVLGPGRWIAFAKAPTIYLTEAALSAREREAAIRAIAADLRELPGVARAEPVADLVGGCAARTGADVALCRSLHAERSGEVLFVPQRGWIFEDDDEPVAASHGSPYDYDQVVPIITLPFGRRPGPTMPAAEPTEVPMTDVAGTLASWLSVPAPATLPSH